MPQCWHHVTQRGNHQQTVFFTDADREFYLRTLLQYSTQYGMRVGGYCLMGNHVHLLAIPLRENALAQAVGRTHNDYARWQNFKRGEKGHLWQNRFYSCPLDEAHRWMALRYVELNPVLAGLAARAEDWRWSSAPAHVTGQDARGLLEWTDWEKRWRPDTWREALTLGIEGAAWIARIREATRTGRPAGSEEFVREVEVSVKRCLLPRKRGPKPRGEMREGQMHLGVT